MSAQVIIDAVLVREDELNQESIDTPFNEGCNLPSHHTTARATGATYLNQGGLGGPPLNIIKMQRYIEDQCNAQPMIWNRSVVPPLMQRAKEKAC
jgi:hypothetical protein